MLRAARGSAASASSAMTLLVHIRSESLMASRQPDLIASLRNAVARRLFGAARERFVAMGRFVGAELG